MKLEDNEIDWIINYKKLPEKIREKVLLEKDILMNIYVVFVMNGKVVVNLKKFIMINAMNYVNQQN